MIHASLFSGIGAFDLAAEWLGWSNLFHVEWNPYCQKVLKQHFPNSHSHANIKETDFTKYRYSVDVLTGGFPCQPYSLAGKRLGSGDDRHLWPEMFRAVREIKPAFVVPENVPGLISWGGGLVFESVCNDLESEGYEIIPFILPAIGLNAPHKRERVFLIAYSDSARLQINVQREQRSVPQPFTPHEGYTFDRTPPTGREWEEFPHQSHICRGNDGVPDRVDRIKSLGNAIVPQIAYQILKSINTFNEML
jgi:DNA (cytosine-5)-methyltransferase 1